MACSEERAHCEYPAPRIVHVVWGMRVFISFSRCRPRLIALLSLSREYQKVGVFVYAEVASCCFRIFTECSVPVNNSLVKKIYL